MNDVRFELNHIQIVNDDFNKVSKDVSDSIYYYQKYMYNLEKEISLFGSENVKSVNQIQSNIHTLNDLIYTVENRKKRALSQKEEESSIPPSPNIPSDVSADERAKIMSRYNELVSAIIKKNEEIRKNNNRIDSYVKKCEKTVNELEKMINNSNKIINSLKNDVKQVNSNICELMVTIKETNNRGPIINQALEQFSYALKDTIEKAIRIQLMNPIKLKGESFIDRQFIIKNTHSHMISSSNVFDFSGLTNVENIALKDKKTYNEAEITIRTRSVEELFSEISNLNSFMMPSMNLSKFGGKKFIAKMEEKGYSLRILKDGKTIDNNGMLHWEKKND